MTKFSISNIPVTDETKPVLYRIELGNRYYLHKGKTLKESAERFLDDVFRGIRGKSCPDLYSKVVDYCRLHPQIYNANIEVILNDESDRILRKEKILFSKIRIDANCLNRGDLEPYKPEWMIKQSLQKRCGKCITSGFISANLSSNNPCFAKKHKFKFCPNCGRLNK